MIKVNTRTKKNPTDKELLEQIRIEKYYDSDYDTIKYYALLNNQVVASAIFDQYAKHVDLVRTSIPFQRKGLATYLYNYIEQDQKVKLKPNDYLLEPGKAFWKNRLKNPTDLSFLRLIKITKKIVDCRFDNDIIVYYIWFRNKKIGYVELTEGSDSIEDIKIDEEYRRKGLATYLYNYIEKDLKIKLQPNSIQLEDGKAFWKARLKK